MSTIIPYDLVLDKGRVAILQSDLNLDCALDTERLVADDMPYEWAYKANWGDIQLLDYEDW